MAASRNNAATLSPARRRKIAAEVPAATISRSAAAPRVAEPMAEPAAARVSDVATDPTPDQIAERAYFIWLRKGRPVGLDQQNWSEAEAELRTETPIR